MNQEIFSPKELTPPAKRFIEGLQKIVDDLAKAVRNKNVSEEKRFPHIVVAAKNVVDDKARLEANKDTMTKAEYEQLMRGVTEAMTVILKEIAAAPKSSSLSGLFE